MKIKKWIKTKQEFKINEHGIPQPITFTEELVVNDIIDITLKSLPLIAIVISIFIFFRQQKNENLAKKELFRTETFINTTTVIRTMLEKDIYDEKFADAQDELLMKIYPKLKFIGEPQILHAVDSIISSLNEYIRYEKTRILELETIQAWPSVFNITGLNPAEAKGAKDSIRMAGKITAKAMDQMDRYFRFRIGDYYDLPKPISKLIANLDIFLKDSVFRSDSYIFSHKSETIARLRTVDNHIIKIRIEIEKMNKKLEVLMFSVVEL